MLNFPSDRFLSGPILEELAGPRSAKAAELFRGELTRVRSLYVKVGDPSTAYRFGETISGLAPLLQSRLPEVAAYELLMTELLLASGNEIARAELHLQVALRHAEQADIPGQFRARLLSKGHFLRAVVTKAVGDRDESMAILDSVRDSTWWRSEVSPDDEIMLQRQRIMMRGSLEEHTAMLVAARAYRESRPLEYFRTLKRVFEVFVNGGHVQSAAILQPRLISAYATASSGLAPISKVSLLKNLTQSTALLGAPATAMRYGQSAREEALRLGLVGQVRQLDRILAGVEAGYVVGTLETFRIP